MEIKASDYSIHIGEIFQEFQQFLQEHYPDSKKFVIVDENTEERCLPLLDWGGVDALSNAEILTIEPGEEHKNIGVVNSLWEALLECGADRKSVVINLGGGVIGDMGGFVAATFKRGLDFIQVPTTLLSMVDASVGGKLGIDLSGQKNMVGLFQHPNAVFVAPEFLKTLDRRLLYSGFAEVLKHGLIADRAYWKQITNIPDIVEEDLESVIAKSIEIKHAIVEADFKESGERKKLNFGHTAGHAFETLLLETEYKLEHGEAVAAGMIVESYLSAATFESFQSDFEEVIAVLLKNYALPQLNEQVFPVLVDLMKNDKKNNGGKIEFVLLKQIGEASIGHVFEEEAILNALSFYNSVVANS